MKFLLHAWWEKLYCSRRTGIDDESGMRHKKALVAIPLIVASFLIMFLLFTPVTVPPLPPKWSLKDASMHPPKANGWMQEGAYRVVVRFCEGFEDVTTIYVEVTEGENYWVKGHSVSIEPDTIFGIIFVFPEVTQYPSTAQVRVRFNGPYVIIPVQRARIGIFHPFYGE